MNDLELKMYRYDPKTKKYRGVVICQIDPLETEKNGRITYIVPGNSTDKIPPEPKDGYDILWTGTCWVQEPIPNDEPEPHEPTVEEKQEGIRSLRNHYLNETDKVFMPDFPIDMAGRESYKLYRQYLRDYTTIANWWESEPLKYDDWLLQSEK